MRYLNTVFRKYLSVSDTRLTLTRLGAPLLYATVASKFWSRFRGVHGVRQLGPTDALVIKPCRSVHTFGLKYTLDIMFLDDDGAVLQIDTVKPQSWKACLSAAFVIEMAEGTAKRLGFKCGQIILPEEGAWQ